MIFAIDYYEAIHLAIDLAKDEAIDLSQNFELAEKCEIL